MEARGVKRASLRRWSWVLAFPACVLIAAIAYAHPGHGDALTTLQAVWRGKIAVRRLIEEREPVDGEQLDESWKDIDGRSSCVASPLYYLVGLENRSEGKTLYVLLSHSGAFLRARFDKGFAELKFTSSFPLVECTRW